MNRTLDKLVLKNKISGNIDVYIDDLKMTELEIVQKICDKYKLDEPTAQEYYDNYMHENAE